MIPDDTKKEEKGIELILVLLKQFIPFLFAYWTIVWLVLT